MTLETLVREETQAPDARKLRRVLVTGAAGCVGSFLLDELLERGYEVQAADRPGLRLAQEGREGLTSVGVDLRDPEAAARCVRGADAVVHAAAVVDISMDFEQLRAINLDSVRTLYEAARREGAAAFIFLSSGSIYRASAERGATPIGEDEPLGPSSDYERTKLWAEEYLRSRPPGGPRVAILRPALVFGPRGRVLGSALATVAPLLARYVGSIPGLKGGPRTNWVHARDVARAAVFLLEHLPPVDTVYNVANDDPLTLGETLAAAARATGLGTLGVGLPLPQTLLRLLGVALQPRLARSALNAVLRRLWRGTVRRHGLRGPLEPRIDREMLDYLSGDVVFDNSRLKAAGFELLYPRFEPAWRETVEWYRKEGWLPPAPAQRKAFRFSETMGGTLTLDEAPENGAHGRERSFRFTVTASADSLRGFLLRGETLRLDGVADVEGIATLQPARGTLDLAPWVRRELVYELEFSSDRGEPLRFYGKKRIRHSRPVSTWTTLRGTVLRCGMPIGQSTLRFDLRELPKLLASARPW
jgi:nucleoside-diphosphate-sugar epimerase